MAEHLASIFGTEKDRVNCPFYFKIGVCRHGDRCSRLHNKPTISQTMLIQNMYQNPVLTAPMGPDGLPRQVDAREAQEHYEDFYEDVFEELAQYGELENLNICDNLADHMVGNVYAKFRDEDAAMRALQALQGRYYDRRPIMVEFSPVTDFREATCRQYEENTCNRGGYCNFMHLKPISKELRKILWGRYKRRSESPRRDERARGGAGGGFGGGGGRGRGGGDRRDDRYGGGGHGGGDRRGRSRSRERDGRGGGGGGGRERESSAERRAKIASWNKSSSRPEDSQPQQQHQQQHHGGYGAPPPQQHGGYDGQPPAGGGYGMPPQQPPAGAYGAPPPDYSAYGQPPPQGGYYPQQ